MMGVYPVLQWQTVAGSTLLIVGLLSVYNLFAMKNTVFKNSTLGFYAVVINPGLVSIFTGITCMAMQDPRFRLLFIVAGIGMTVSIPVGFVILTVAIIRSNTHKENI
jgi:hypothetical protein